MRRPRFRGPARLRRGGPGVNGRHRSRIGGTALHAWADEEARMRDPIAEFKEYNLALARRNPELLRYKVARMAEGPFPFYRGTFHLFARDVLAGLAGLP